MGRQDGSGRLVTEGEVDDEGTGILHVDMDAFFAAVAVLDDPSLAGLPVIVGGTEGRGVVASATYQARRYGVRSAMPMARALQLCPRARVVAPDFGRYQELSSRVMAIFERVTPLVEQLSIDEAFLDVRGARRLWGPPARIAHGIRHTVRRETGLTCSIGVASTKHVAKLASTLAKPDGMLVVPVAENQAFLDARGVRELWGVGPRAADDLAARGIRSVAELREAPFDQLVRVLGAAGAAKARALAHGEDDRAVVTDRAEKSVSHEHTYAHDVHDRGELRRDLTRLSDRVAVRLRRAGWEACGVAIKVRFDDFRTLTRSRQLSEPSASGHRIATVAAELLAGLEDDDPVRLIGVRAERLIAAGSAPPALWDDDCDWKRLDGAMDAATERFGEGVVGRASALRPPSAPAGE